MKKKIFSLIMCGVLLVCIAGCGNNNINQVKEYFENIDYECNESGSKTITCSRESDMYKEEVYFSNSNGNYISYEIDHSNFKDFRVSSEMYEKETEPLTLTLNYITDDYDREKIDCIYATGDYYDTLKEKFDNADKNYLRMNDYFVKLNIGDTVRLIPRKGCRDYSEEYNKFLREFEKYCKDNNIKIK